MIFDDIYEATTRDMYFYYRGELKEFLRNHPGLDARYRQMMLNWVKTGLGHSIHDNPWLIRNENGAMLDYLDALKLMESAHAK